MSVYTVFRRWAVDFAERMTSQDATFVVEERWDAEFYGQFPSGFSPGGFTGRGGDVRFEYAPMRFRDLLDGLSAAEVEEFLDEVIIWWSLCVEHQFWQHTPETAVMRFELEYPDDYAVFKRFAAIAGVTMEEFLLGRDGRE